MTNSLKVYKEMAATAGQVSPNLKSKQVDQMDSYIYNVGKLSFLQKKLNGVN